MHILDGDVLNARQLECSCASDTDKRCVYRVMRPHGITSYEIDACCASSCNARLASAPSLPVSFYVARMRTDSIARQTAWAAFQICIVENLIQKYTFIVVLHFSRMPSVYARDGVTRTNTEARQRRAEQMSRCEQSREGWKRGRRRARRAAEAGAGMVRLPDAATESMKCMKAAETGRARRRRPGAVEQSAQCRSAIS